MSYRDYGHSMRWMPMVMAVLLAGCGAAEDEEQQGEADLAAQSRYFETGRKLAGMRQQVD